MNHDLGVTVSPVLAGRRPLLLVPLGSTEQHGPHLPLDTDTRIADALANAAADMLHDGHGIEVLVAPPLPYGSAGEHADFPGTLSIGQDALEAIVVELGRSAENFAGVIFVCGHGGNVEAVQRAVQTLQAEGRGAAAWFPTVPGGDAHAGRTETSLMLHLAPDLVRFEAAKPGVTTPLADLLPELHERGVAAVSPNGILGDPTGASAEEGRRLFDALVADLVDACTQHLHASQRLQ